MAVSLPLAVHPIAVASLGFSAGLFVMSLLWAIRPGGLSLLARLSLRERTFRQAKRLLKEGNWQAAFAEAGQLRNPKKPDPELERRLNSFEGDCLYRAAEGALESRKYAEALELMRGAGDRLGMPEKAFDQRIVDVLLAEIRRRVASDPQAKDLVFLVNEVLRVTGGCPEASFWLGLHYLHVRNADEARASFHDAATDRASPDAALYFGALQLRTGLAKEATPWLERAAQLAPDSPVIQWQLGAALCDSGGDAVQAVRYLEKASAPQGLARHLNDPTKIWSLTLPPASWLATLGKKVPFSCPLGLDQIDVAVAAARRSLALSLDRCDRSTDAATVYYQAFSAGDDAPMVRRGLGLSLARSGLYDDAKPHLEAARAAESPPTPLTIGYLALSTARAQAASVAEQTKAVAAALQQFIELSVRRDPEWAKLARDLFEDAKTHRIELAPVARSEFAQVFASVAATDDPAVAAYDLLASDPDSVTFDVAVTYVRAAWSRAVRGQNDEALFARAFSERDHLRFVLTEAKVPFAAVERLYLDRWAVEHSGRYPDAPGPLFAAQAERMLIEESRRAEAEGRTDAARSAIDLAFHLGPMRALTLDRLAEIADRRGDRDEVLSQLKTWADLHPYDPRPFVRKALIEYREGRTIEALEELTRACERASGPGRGKLLILSAKVAIAANELDAAFELLDQARLGGHPDPDGIVALGALAWTRHDFDQLAPLAGELEQASGTDPGRSLIAAVAHTLAGNEGDTAAALNRVAPDRGLAGEAAILEATFLAGLNREFDARSVISAVDATGPAREPLLAQRGQLAWRAGDFASALKDFDAISPERRIAWGLESLLPQTAFFAATAILKSGKAHEAIRLARRAADGGVIDPRLEQLQLQALQRAVQEVPMGDGGAALDGMKQLEASLSVGGLKPTRAAWLARGFRRQGHLDEARRLLDAVDEPNVYACLQRGMIHLTERQLAAAEGEFAVALENDPQSIAAAVNLALTRLSLGRLDELPAALDQAIALSSAPDIRKFLGYFKALLPTPGGGDGCIIAAADEQRLLKRIQRIGKLETAVPMVERLARANPESNTAKQARAEALVLWTKHLIDRGEPAVALQLDPTEAVAGGKALRNLLGLAACMCGQYGKAIKFFQAALPVQGDDARVQQNLALAASWQNDIVRAKAHWIRYLQNLPAHGASPPGDPDYIFRLGRLVRERVGIEVDLESPT